MISIGPLPQNHDRASAENLLVTIGPLTLSVRPLSPYQQTLIDTIFHLRFTGWNDSQIANHFNDAGYLTPRGHQLGPSKCIFDAEEVSEQIRETWWDGRITFG